MCGHVTTALQGTRPPNYVISFIWRLPAPQSRFTFQRHQTSNPCVFTVSHLRIGDEPFVSVCTILLQAKMQRGDINEGVVLFSEVGRIFKRGAVFSSQISPRDDSILPRGDILLGGGEHIMTPASTVVLIMHICL